MPKDCKKWYTGLFYMSGFWDGLTTDPRFFLTVIKLLNSRYFWIEMLCCTLRFDTLNPSWTGLPELRQGLGVADLPYHYKISKLGRKPFFSKFAIVCITSK
jgi:hypothetical protein